MLTVYPIRAFRDNYIWVLHNTQNAILLDPGDATPCLDYLAAHHLRLVAMLVTHHHADHTGGILTLARHYRARVIGPADELIPGRTEIAADNTQITIPELALQFEVIATPGHTLGYITYYGANRLFCGDTLFGCGCGRLFEGTPEMMHSSLQRLASLPDFTGIFCAHEYTLSNIQFARSIDGDNHVLIEREQTESAKLREGHPTLPSTLLLEKATNPFLRCHEPALIKAAERYLKRPPVSTDETFAALREMKNRFP